MLQSLLQGHVRLTQKIPWWVENECYKYVTKKMYKNTASLFQHKYQGLSQTSSWYF